MIERTDRPLALADWLSALSAITVHELSLTVTIARATRFDQPVNVVARGLLGDAFRARRCLTAAPTCVGCDEASACDFDRVFERDEGMGQRSFWLRGLTAARSLDAGSSLRVTLSALESERGALPDFMAALRHALERLGVHTEFNSVALIARRSEALSLRRDEEARSIRVNAMTPLLLRGDEAAAGSLCPHAPGFAMLLRAGVRRLAGMLRANAPGDPVARVEWPALQGLRCTDDQMTRWRDARVSRAQGRRQPLEGLVGSAVLEGEGVSDLLPLLRVLERVGVGRKTSFGFGELRVEIVK